MNENDELKEELEQELQWIQYRRKMLDIIENKLLQMRQLIEKAKQDNLDKKELKVLNDRVNKLAVHIKALDEESKKIMNRKIL